MSKEKQIVYTERILYSPSSFARSALLFLQEVGRLTALEPHTKSRSGLSSYLLLLVHSGSGCLEVGEDSYLLSAGDVCFIDCSHPYSHTTSSDLWTISWIHFSGFQMESLYEKYRSRGGQIVFRPPSLSSFESCVSSVYELASSLDPIRDMRINEVLNHLMTLLMAESWHPEFVESGKRGELEQVREYIASHYFEKLSLDSLSALFFMNKFYLAKIFKEKYGMTVNAYLSSCRLAATKQKLRFSTCSLEEIAAAVGWKDAQYLSRMFKKLEGMTPGEYRKNW
ncbi:AraC family transcriptional regulator [uncultured Dubosiella sp.]|uniref:AraC family transcriptional regulator n=1 Tax=uncultured Dubosiella sp. TaxID=1937011 RepID=UPI0032B19E84